MFGTNPTTPDHQVYNMLPRAGDIPRPLELNITVSVDDDDPDAGASGSGSAGTGPVGWFSDEWYVNEGADQCDYALSHLSLTTTQEAGGRSQTAHLSAD